MKKHIAIFLSFVLLISLCPFAMAETATYDYLVECEEFTASNFRVDNGSRVVSDTNLSGGAYFGLYTKTAGEYTAEYSVDVESAGVYDLFIASSPVEGSSWSSKIYMIVNDGEKVALSGTLVSSTGNSRIKYYNVGAVNLNQGTNTIKYVVSDKLSSGYYSAFIDCFGLNLSSFGLRYLDSSAPMNVFENGDEITLSVNTNAPATADSTFSYSLSDIYGTVISNGNVVVQNGKSKADITFKNLGLGYYNLTVGTLKCGFSIVKPLKDRTTYQDTPFAVDTGFSGVYDNGIDAEDYAKVVGLSGVSWIRDRIRMNNGVTYSDGQYSFSNNRSNMVAQLLDQYGIKVSTAADYMPSSFVNDYGTYIPDDLIESYNFWKSAASKYGEAIDNWEIFNEVDNGGTVSSWDSPDLYAAFMKAAAVGINDGSNAMTSVQGAMTSIEHKYEYGKILARNGVFDYSAFDNVHHHKFTTAPYADYIEFDGITKVPERVNVQKELAERVPIWVTEAGLNIEAAEGTDMSLEQQLVQAKFLVTSSVESIASGTDKHFFFIGPRYHEGEINWGMMSEDTFRPYMYASLSAQSAMTDMLGKGIYKGQITRFGDSISAYIFNNGISDVIVVWSKNGTQNLTFSANGKVYDMWGNKKLTVNGSTSISVSTEPVYIVCDSHTENATNNRDAQMVAVKQEINDAQRVILLQKYSDISRGGSRTDGYMISDENNTVTLEITNLSDKTMTGRINYKTENGWKLNKEYQDVTVAPMSVKSVEFTIIPVNGVTTDYLSFIGTFNGQVTSPSTVKLVSTRDGIITLEAETDTKLQNGFSAYIQDEYQGIKLFTSTADKYKIEFEVISKENGVYDLWTLGSILNHQGCSNHVVKVNGKEITPSSKNTTDVVYWIGDNAVGWNSFNDVKLNRGVNTVEFIVSDIRNSGDENIVSALDKIIFMPKDMSGYIEAEKYTTKKGMYYTETNSVASDSTVEKLFTYNIQEPITDNQLTYDFAIDVAGGYDIWILSSRANVDWLTKWKIGVDGTPEYPSVIDWKASGTTIDGQEMHWSLIKQNVSLNRGIHTITLRGDEERASGTSYMFHIADAIVVVPSSSYSWNRWSPSKNVVSDKIGIVQKTLFSEYDLNNITDNITLPEKIDNVNISWSSNNADVISTEGVVNRPESNESDVTVRLTATFTSGSTTKTSNYDLKVKKFAEGEKATGLWAHFEKTDDGYSNIRFFAKNTDVLADENGNMPAVVVAKYRKSTGEFIGFVGDRRYNYTNEAGDEFVVSGNRVYCHINGANPGNDVTFAVYKEGTKPGKETIAYVNEYYPTKADSSIDFSFETDKGEAAYRVVINKNGETYSKIIHIFEEQVIIYDDNDTQDDKFVKIGIGQRIISTKGEVEMPVWRFLTPEDDDDILYKVFLWEWYSLTPLVESIVLNN